MQKMIRLQQLKERLNMFLNKRVYFCNQCGSRINMEEPIHTIFITILSMICVSVPLYSIVFIGWIPGVLISIPVIAIFMVMFSYITPIIFIHCNSIYHIPYIHINLSCCKNTSQGFVDRRNSRFH